jgi:general L-amino acid transport system permease protein
MSMVAESEFRSAMPAKPPFWNDPSVRSIFYQALAVVAVLALALFVISNTIHNLQKQNIASGFGFLNVTSGFAIGSSLIEYNETSTYGRAFLVGLLNTLLVSALGIVCATVIGFIIGIARLSSNWLVAKLAAAYIEIIRNIPLLLQIFFWYFAVLRALPSARQSVSIFGVAFLNIRGFYVPKPLFQPGFDAIPIAFLVGVLATIFLYRWAKKRQEATGQIFPTGRAGLALIVGLPLIAAIATGFPVKWDIPRLQGFNFVGGSVLIPEFASLLVGLSIYTSAYIAEIVRGGIMAVSHGQTEAAGALGLTRLTMLRLVVIPQAMRVIIPPLTSQYLNLTKNSSLAAAIAYPELVSVFAGTVLNQTGQAVETIGVTMLVYLAISLTISLAMNLYNRKMALVER